VLPKYNVLKEIGGHYEGIFKMMMESIVGIPFWLSVAGITTAWLAYIKFPAFPEMFTQRFALLYNILVSKYGFDAFNQIVFVKGGKKFADVLYNQGDMKIIDGFFVNGSAKVVRGFSAVIRHMQSGYLYHYAFVMILGLLGFLSWLILR